MTFDDTLRDGSSFGKLANSFIQVLAFVMFFSKLNKTLFLLKAAPVPIIPFISNRIISISRKF